MKLLSLSFRNFRNLRDADVVDIPDVPLLVASAPNATGKTNFLEAVAVLLRGKSFRASHEECVAWGKDLFLVQGEVEGRDGKAALAVQYHTPSRKLRIEQNTEPISPVLFYANYPIVLFLPDDTFLLHRGPAVRRNFINSALATSTSYLSGLVQYQRSLRQRNTALKNARSPDDVAAWTSIVAEHAKTVWAGRESFFTYLVAQLPAVLDAFSPLGDEIEIRFNKGAPNDIDLAQALSDAWPQEERYKYTLYGPHRDDFDIYINGRPARAVLSRGQIRSLVISMKVVTYQFIKQTSGMVPLLLLDEVLSELDEGRQHVLFELLPSTQTFLTCTEMPAEVKKRSDVYMLDLQQLVGPAPAKDTSRVVVEEEREAVGAV